uniref:Uncharacterized protein n=1 Tax=Mimivirus LCMiAC02 TaxID=2506609 RepID=A0A4D5XF31_9VIRU|nr:MAG: hypothetical protein LCMiAC02_03510 [Mimivirus LCMiAC02]
MEFIEKLKVFGNEVKGSIDKKYKEFEQSDIYQNTKKNIINTVQNNDFLKLIDEDLKKENKALKLENDKLKQINKTLQKENKRMKIMLADKMLFSENSDVENIPLPNLFTGMDISSLPLPDLLPVPDPSSLPVLYPSPDTSKDTSGNTSGDTSLPLLLLSEEDADW